MRSLSILVAFAAVVLLAVPGNSYADVPQMINYQGFLTDAAGAPLDTTVSMTFTIYDDSTGGASKWMETHPSVAVVGGMFGAMIGESVPIDDSVFMDAERWLGIQVGSDPEIRPRTRLAAVPYAYRVSTVDGSTGGIISGDVSIQSDLVVSGKATIGPGHTNTGTNAFVAGANNTVLGDYASVGGGQNNAANQPNATIGGGILNAATMPVSTVAGGEQNGADADHAAIGGGGFNWIMPMGEYSFVGGGMSNQIHAHAYSVITGGQENLMEGAGPEGQHNVISGGLQNQIMDMVTHSAIPGGSMNRIHPEVDHSMAFGMGVDCFTDFQVMFFDSTNPGVLRLNCDDIDLPGPSPGPILVGTSPANGNGAFLSPGGVWTPGSSRDIKENITLLDGKDVLGRITQLQIAAWQYVGSTERHIWPYAEEFVRLFDVGVTTADGERNDKHLAAGDIAGVALAGVQQLAKENDELRQIIRDLTQRIEELESANR